MELSAGSAAPRKKSIVASLPDAPPLGRAYARRLGQENPRGSRRWALMRMPSLGGSVETAARLRGHLDDEPVLLAARERRSHQGGAAAVGWEAA